MTKTELRRLIRQRKHAHTAIELQRLSAASVEALCLMPEWQSADTVLLYYSLPDEVDTHDLVRRTAAEGRTVLLPRVDGDDLTLHRYDGDGSLQSGAFNILEPSGPLFTDLDAISLAVVPGMAFTHCGDRLGRGKGFYDHLLPRLTQAYKIGLCWPFQIVEQIPTDVHDQRMNAVVCG